VQHYILTPLGMKNSTLLYHDVDPQLMSNGHVLDSQAILRSARCTRTTGPIRRAPTCTRISLI